MEKVKVGQWVIVNTGKYKGELGKVLEVIGNEADIKLTNGKMRFLDFEDLLSNK